ncbi:MAG: hypothetical protein JO129_02625 [Candidatus Dependentiae bacterium]|nr:hypothetical protein [Candidatus Dependentiae bacterium]
MKNLVSIFLAVILFSCNLQAMFAPSRSHSKLLFLCRQQFQRTICMDCPAMETVWSKLDTQRYGALTKERYFALEMKRAATVRPEDCRQDDIGLLDRVDIATTLRIAESSKAGFLNNRKSVILDIEKIRKNCPHCSHRDSNIEDNVESEKSA